MSNPTRGTPAGKSPTTGDLPLTREYEDNHSRIFGDRKPTRGRWVYTDGGKPLEEPEQVGGEWVDPGRQAPRRSEEEVYGKVQATDGTDISSRTKRREYMKRHGVTDASDYSPAWWDKTQKQRKERALGQDRQSREHRREVMRAAFERTRK